MTSNQVAEISQGAPAAAPAALDPAALLRIAVEKDADIEKLERLMSLQERWEKSEALKAFDAAMSAFKAEAPIITKNNRVGYGEGQKKTEYWHATLDHICQTINPKLSEHGLSYSWETSQDNGLVTVTCVVSHVRGHRTRTPLSSTPDGSGGKNSIQSIGSAVSYLQRYTLLAALGLATEGQDDDGRHSSQGDKHAAPQALSADQIKNLRALISFAGITEADLAKKARAPSIEEINPVRYDAVCKYLKSLREGDQS